MTSTRHWALIWLLSTTLVTLAGAQAQGAANAAAPRIGCQNCPSSLLIAVDADCSLRVDGQDIGKIPVDGSKLVRVGMGEHLIVARSGELKWESVVNVQKPGQTVIRTGFAKVRADAKQDEEQRNAKQARQAIVNKWKGEWFGEDLHFEDQWERQGIISAVYEAFTFTISNDGNCTVRDERGHASDPSWGIDGDGKPIDKSSEVRPRVRERAINSRSGSDYSCDLLADGTIRSVFGTVTSSHSFTFKTLDDQRPTIILRKQ